uniref:Uncharacterized protein n=1 Tax=Glossina austeni TaxID=7395 RepID=A0A1A9V355_GLOAU
MSNNKLACDPIIIFYNKLLKRTQADLKFPEFSEIFLRLSLKEYINANSNFSSIVQLYRKLLVLYYCEKYPSLNDVSCIMGSIFTSNDLIAILNERNNLLDEWQNFVQSNSPNNDENTSDIQYEEQAQNVLQSEIYKQIHSAQHFIVFPIIYDNKMDTLNDRNYIKPKICSKIKDDITALDAILLECFKRNLFGKYHACNDTVDDKVKLLCTIFGVPNHQLSPETWIEHLNDTNNTTSETKFIKFAFLDEIRNILTDKRPHIALSTFQKFMYRLDFETLKETENLKIPNESNSPTLNDHIFYEAVDNCRDDYSNDDTKMDINVHIANNDIAITRAMQETEFTCKREEEKYCDNEEVLITDSTNAIDNEMLERILLADMENDLQASYVYRSDHRDSDIKQESIINDTTEDIPPVMEYEKNRFPSFKDISTQLKQESARNKNNKNNKNNNSNNNNNNNKSKINDNLLENHKLEGAVEASEIFDLLKSLERNDDEIEEMKMSEKRKQADESSINQVITKAQLNSKRKKLRCCVTKNNDNLIEFDQKSHLSDLAAESLIMNEEKQCFKGTSINVIDLNGKCENYVITTATTCDNNNCNSCNNKSIIEKDKKLRKSIESFKLDNNMTFLEENSVESDKFSEDLDFLRIMQEVEKADKALHNEDDANNVKKEERKDHHYYADRNDADNDNDIILIEDSDSEDGKSFSVNNNSHSDSIEGTIATATTITTITTTTTTATKALDESGDFNT